MKSILAIAALVMLSGCFVETVTTTAIQSQNAAEGAKAAMGQKDHAVGQLDKTQTMNAIRTYEAETGNFPPSLDALVPDYLPAVPTKADGSTFDYDPATGTLL